MSALSYDICLFFPVWRSCCNSVDCGLCSSYRLKDTELCLLWTLASMFVCEREYLSSVRVFVQKASVVVWDSVSLWALRGQSGWVGGGLSHPRSSDGPFTETHLVYYLKSIIRRVFMFWVLLLLCIRYLILQYDANVRKTLGQKSFKWCKCSFCVWLWPWGDTVIHCAHQPAQLLTGK